MIRNWLRKSLGIEQIAKDHAIIAERLMLLFDRVVQLEKQSPEAQLIADLSKKQAELQAMFQELREIKQEILSQKSQVVRTRGWQQFRSLVETE